MLAYPAMRDDEERVLVVERRLIERIGMFQGLEFALPRYLPELLSPRNYRFVPRRAAEQDETLKQLIPYFIITHAGGVWCYTRGKKSGEDRLVAKVSIGIGGHINQLDENLFEDVYSRAAMRELEEEVAVAPGYTHKIVALLNDDDTPVGRVHLGIIHVLQAADANVSKREGVITETGFRSPNELRGLRERMETWAQICFDQLDELLARG
jgi:predicted NUDIX family phosphoesterase